MCGIANPTITRVVAFGDSITMGLGARGRPYPVVVAERLGVPPRNLSGTAMMVDVSAAAAGECQPGDLVLIMQGITEAIPRIPAGRLRRLPRRWAGLGHMDPRPYYSTRARRRVFELVESDIRWRVKSALLRRGGAPLMSPEAYEHNLAGLVGAALSVTPNVVVIVGAQISDRYFPGAAPAIDAYSQLSRTVADRSGVMCVDISRSLRRWDDYLADHFHPSAGGHAKIAETVLRALGHGSIRSITAQKTELTRSARPSQGGW
jgi:lysophospholipase L1-like esterase